MSVGFDFAGKKAVVTGASQGIGRTICQELVKAGCEVYGLARNVERLESLKNEVGALFHPVPCDVTSSRATLAALLAPLHPFDYLVNNAGVLILEPADAISEENLDKVMNVNFKAPLLLSGLVAKEWIATGHKGTIVNMSSQSAMKPFPNHAVYCASKAALDHAMRVQAVEWGKYGIRVNAVNPTVVWTDMGKEVAKIQKWNDKTDATVLLDRMPIRRFAEEKEVSDAVLFLLSDASAMTQGATLPVDGGYTTN